MALRLGTPRLLDRLEVLRLGLRVGLHGVGGVPPLPAVVALRELFLQAAAVEQHQLDELGGRGCEVDRPLEALAHGDREQAAVVEVGMCDQDRVERGRVETE